MKKIFIIMIVFNSLILLGQDREPSPWLFSWGDSDQGRIFQPDSFKQASMFTGFQWSNTLPMDNALFNNCVAEHGLDSIEAGSRVLPLNSINQPTWWDRGTYWIGAYFSPFMQYEPTLLLHDTTEGKILRPADPSDPVFGFKHVMGIILNDSTDENYSRLILYKDNLPSYGSDGIVLKNIWPQPQFTTREFFGNGSKCFKSKTSSMGQTDNYLGRIWYLTINLKRLNPAVDSICDDSVVLSLQIPYTLWNGTTGLIKFDSIPISNINSVKNLNYYENRGYSQLIRPASPKPYQVDITRNMLPIRTDTSSITISAAFFTNGDPDLHNPQFSDDSSTFKIKDIDIVVKYYGKTDIAIDYVRIESINAHFLLRGQVDSIKPKYPNQKDHRGFLTLYTDPDHPKDSSGINDRYIEQPNQIKGIIQSCIDTMKKKSHDWQDAKLFRFYYQDVESDKFYWWGPLRYCNKLTNGMFITRDEQTYPKIYEYYTKCPNRWVGFVYSKDDYHMPTPYAKNGNESWKSMNLKFGYIGAYNIVHFPNTINSDYETHVENTIPPDDNYYNGQILSSPTSLQETWERSLYESYYKQDNKLSEMLYSDKPWWLYHLLYNATLDIRGTDTNIIYNYYRPKTGEEIRMLLNSSLIRGCKGFIYDGDENYHFPECHMGNMGIGDGKRISDTSDFFSNWVGADYIDSINNTWNAFGYAKLDVLAEKMGVPENKVYIGTRSIRTELFNFHSRIRRADEELMKLRLVASYSKGYRTHQNHHPDYPANILSQYLAWDTIRNRIDTTRFLIRPVGRYKRIYQPDGEWNPVPLYEPWDSTFIDFTLLKNVDSKLNDLAYIGVQNRRTDPLVPWFIKYDWYHKSDTDSVYIPFYDIKFYSTAEFEDSCDAIKNPTSYQSFRNKWFNRLGCRSVTLPFNYINPENPDEYALLKITELGADEEFDPTWSYSRKMAYWNKIDTVIGQDKSITFNMLPGEGKIFKVQVLHSDSTVAGSLYHNGQSKLVSHPVIWENGLEGDSIRYHLVYHKYIETNRNGVFYRRSIPIKKDCNEENIVWESEVLVSGSVVIDSVFKVTRSCDYPSIVVRKDANGVLKAYIVYSCDKKSNLNMIAETILEVNNATVSSPNGKELSEYRGVNRFEWGNPVVNASSNGNYYAWSDSTGGIVAAWKTPNAETFQFGDKISLKYDYDREIIAKHPSLNVYSHLDSLEDNCALVWQENQTNLFSAPNRILYTRLKRISSLYNYLPATFLGNPSLIEISNNVASIYNSLLIVQNPVISRKLGFYRKSGYPPSLCRRYDLIYWELANSYYYSSLNFLANMLVYNYDTSNVPINWDVKGANYIKSHFSVINTPDIIHQERQDDTYGAGGAAILNFMYARNLVYPYVGQFSYNSNSYASSGSLDSSEINDLWVKSVGSGFLPHLSKSKNLIGETNDRWKNRRVYNNHLGRVISSAKYFYKGGSDELLADWYIGFENADSSKKSFLFGAPELDEQRLSLKLPFEKVISDEGYVSFIETSSDTIASSWFSIDDTKELALKLKGSDNANCRIYIQNKETERTLRLNLPAGLKERQGAKAKYNLINGQSNDFRLLFVKNDESMHYTEELWIEGLPTEEKTTGSFKGSDGIENIDLIQIVNRYYSDNDISIFPNPASEILYLQVNVPFEEANLIVTNLLGTKVIQQRINLNNSPELKLDISFLSPGLYYVFISTTFNSQSDGLNSISGKFLKK